jgi:hypothetical protein
MLDYSIEIPLPLPYHLNFMVELAEEGPSSRKIKSHTASQNPFTTELFV